MVARTRKPRARVSNMRMPSSTRWNFRTGRAPPLLNKNSRTEIYITKNGISNNNGWPRNRYSTNAAHALRGYSESVSRLNSNGNPVRVTPIPRRHVNAHHNYLKWLLSTKQHPPLPRYSMHPKYRGGSGNNMLRMANNQAFKNLIRSKNEANEVKKQTTQTMNAYKKRFSNRLSSQNIAKIKNRQPELAQFSNNAVRNYLAAAVQSNIVNRATKTGLKGLPMKEQRKLIKLNRERDRIMF